MSDPKPTRYDLYLGDEEVRRGVSMTQPLEPEDLLFENRWIVTQIVPAAEDRIDYEAYARRVRPDEVLRPRTRYLVIKHGPRAGVVESYTTRQPVAIGTEIALGVETWVVREVRPKGTLALVDAVIVVEPA
jgi:hypothetical protein